MAGKGGQSHRNRRLWCDLGITVICALGLLHIAKAVVEANALTCNALTDKPEWAGVLTCQKVYHYQPDPFTG